MEKFDKILKVIDELENEYDIGGGEDEDGSLEPGQPNWDKARAKITEILSGMKKNFVSDRDGHIDSPFNMQAILASDPILFDVWKRTPFIFDLDHQDSICIKMIDVEDLKK